jgi:hypothetical protein
MQTYNMVHAAVLALENRFFNLALNQFPNPNNCYTGGIQFAAVDTLGGRDPEHLLPVVCVVGINYTQDPKVSPAFFPYLGKTSGLPRVAQTDAGSRNTIAQLIAAYNRNTAAWNANSPNGHFYPNECGPFGAVAASAKTGLVSHDCNSLKDKFILVMTNRCLLSPS